jgi:hypothetical protein
VSELISHIGLASARLNQQGSVCVTKIMDPKAPKSCFLNRRNEYRDSSSGWIQADASCISMSQDGGWVFTADQRRPCLAVVDTTTNEVSSWIDLPAVGYGTAPTLDGCW